MYRYNMLQKVSPAKDRQMSDVYVVVNNAKFWYGSCVRRNMKLLADFTTRTAFPRRKFAVPLSRSKYCTIRAIDFPLSVASDLTIRHIQYVFYFGTRNRPRGGRRNGDDSILPKTMDEKMDQDPT